MKLSEAAQRKFRHVCVMGDNKSGKSTLASQLAEKGYRLIWISVDNGHDILWKLSPKAQENIELINLPDSKDWACGMPACQRLFNGNEHRVCYLHGTVACGICTVNKGSFTTVKFNALDPNTIVVLDNITHLGESGMNWIIRDKKDEYKPDWDDYKLQGVLNSRILSSIRAANYNVVAIAQAIEVEMEDGQKKLVPSMGTVNYSRTVGSYFDDIVYCGVSTKRHQFGSATTFSTFALTGSRRDIAIETMKEPALYPFFDGSIPQIEMAGAKAAAITLEGKAETIVVAPTAPIVVKDTAPSAGQVSGMHSAATVVEQQSIAPKTATVAPVAPTTAPQAEAGNAHAAAMAALERMKKGIK